MSKENKKAQTQVSPPGPGPGPGPGLNPSLCCPTSPCSPCSPCPNPVYYLELPEQGPLYVQKQGDQLWIHVDGQTLCFPLSSSKTLRQEIPGENEGKEEGEEEGLPGEDSPCLTAPLPGKITKIFVQEGECVEKEKSLLLMEAMKMQYDLKAHRKGKVKKICIGEGQQVELGKTLIVLE